MLEANHPKFGTVRLARNAEELRQRDVEAFMRAFRDLPDDKSDPEYAGRVVRAAVTAQWIEQPVLTVEIVDDLPPAQVTWLARQINTVYAEAMRVDPKA